MNTTTSSTSITSTATPPVASGGTVTTVGNTGGSGGVVVGGGAVKRERDKDKEDCGSGDTGETLSKKHCPDDEEINAQVQNAIDSILNLQKSDPALDEAVRSILTS